MDAKTDQKKLTTSAFLKAKSGRIKDWWRRINWEAKGFWWFIILWPICLSIGSLISIVPQGLTVFFTEFVPYTSGLILNKEQPHARYTIEPVTTIIIILSFAWGVVTFRRDKMREKKAEHEKDLRERKEAEVDRKLEQQRVDMNKNHEEQLETLRNESQAQETRDSKRIEEHERTINALEGHKKELLKQIEKQGKRQERGIRKIGNKASGKDSYKLFSKSIDFYNSVSILFSSLKGLDSEFSSGKYDNIKEIEMVFSNASNLFNNTIAEFWGIRNVVSNLMIYFDESEDSEVIQYLINRTPTLGFVEEGRYYRRGILYLPNRLHRPKPGLMESHALVLPIYSLSKDRINKYDDRVTLPGAPRAFYEGSSAIKSTHHSTAYPGVEKTVKKKAIEYFRRKFTDNPRHILSLRIPERFPQEAKEVDCIAIYNIQAFKGEVPIDTKNIENEAFYSFVYPAMKISTKYLLYYKNYIRDSIITP